MRANTTAVAMAVGLTVLAGLPAGAQVIRQATDEKTVVAGPGALDDAGTTVLAGSSADPLGTNPDHAYQILAFDAVTGAPSEVTSARKGVSVLVSVSDDGRYAAFPSPSDLTGTNPDESVELFVLDRDTGIVTQLTDDPAVDAGTVSTVAIAGDGATIAFVANTDPLGTNPDHLDQLFVIDRVGTGLDQLTAATVGGVGAVSISDDGARIVFAHSADLTGGNADLGGEVFAILSDGTGLVQLTATEAGFASGAPVLSGNGATVAFQSDGDLTGGNAVHQDEIFAVAWTGTGLRQLTASRGVLGITGDPAAQSPSITDDGQTVVFHSNHGTLFPPVNLDGNFEIFRVGSDGSGRTPLTASAFDVGSLLPIVSGSGNRIAYYGIDADVALRVMDGSGGADVALLPFTLIFNQDVDVDPGGTRAVYVRAEGVFSTGEIWRVAADGTDRAPVTALASGTPSSPSIAGDASTIAFASSADPLATNADGSGEVFLVQADGTGLAQLTSGPSGTSSERPSIAADGSVVVFDSDADPLATNVDGSREIFVVGTDGTGLAQLTQGPAGTTSRAAEVDATGGWVVFESDADLDGGNPDGTYEIWRVRADGTGLARLTGDPAIGSRAPDVSGDGTRIVFATAADPLGTNPEGNVEVFAYETAGAVLRQLTSFAEGSSGGARLSGDGTWVTFSSNAPVFESDPDAPSDLYRVPFVGGAVERVGGLRTGVAGAGPVSLFVGGGGALAPDDAGAIAGFSGIGNATGDNPDGLPEVWILDRTTAPRLHVGRETPTVLSWDVESGPVRYDAIRGDLASLSAGSVPGQVDLGAVLCLENDSPDADTVGFGDPADPAPGQGFFFVVRGSPGLTAGPGSYGTAADGAERTPTSGDCAP